MLGKRDKKSAPFWQSENWVVFFQLMSFENKPSYRSLFQWKTNIFFNLIFQLPFSFSRFGAEHIENPPIVDTDGMKKSTHWPAYMIQKLGEY